MMKPKGSEEGCGGTWLQDIFFPEIVALPDPPGHFFERHPPGDFVLSPLPLIQFFLDMFLLQRRQFLQ
jgi:hypothetical protein